MDRLTNVSGLLVQQKKEWGEILTEFETKNKYVVTDQDGTQLYLAAEVGGSTLLRLWLKANRPFTVQIMDGDGTPAMRVRRPFRFYFHKADILDANGALLATIQKRFSLVRRVYTVTDDQGNELCELFGPILHPWTFRIQVDGQELGMITKKWSGLFKEAVSDADNFAVTFPADANNAMKAVLLGAVFLIDFVHFENKGK